MRTVLLFGVCLFLALHLPAQAEIYRWVDAQGHVMYGDNPPKKTAAKAVELPTLTVADGYTPEPNTSTSATHRASEQANTDTETVSAYTTFKIATPAADEAIRANDGTVAITLSLQPELHTGDGITLYLDGKQVANGAQLNFTLNEVERGEHTVFAVLNDATGNIIQNTESVKFNVLRQTVLQGQNAK